LSNHPTGKIDKKDFIELFKKLHPNETESVITQYRKLICAVLNRKELFFFLLEHLMPLIKTVMEQLISVNSSFVLLLEIKLQL